MACPFVVMVTGTRVYESAVNVTGIVLEKQ